MPGPLPSDGDPFETSKKDDVPAASEPDFAFSFNRVLANEELRTICSLSSFTLRFLSVLVKICKLLFAEDLDEIEVDVPEEMLFKAPMRALSLLTGSRFLG